MTDQENYRRSFDAIGGCSEITLDTLMKRKKARQGKTVKTVFCSAALFLSLFLGSNVITYAQTGEAWIAKVLNIKTGNGVEITVKDYPETEANVSQSEITINAADQKDYCHAENGRVIFTFEDKTEDITDLCDGDSYYKHEYTDENGYRHLILAGGTVDDPGWAEYILDEKGVCVFNLMSDSLSADSEDAALAGRITVVNESGGETDDVTFSKSTFVYEEGDPIPAEPDLPAWLEKAEKDLKIGEMP